MQVSRRRRVDGSSDGCCRGSSDPLHGLRPRAPSRHVVTSCIAQVRANLSVGLLIRGRRILHSCGVDALQR